MSADKAASAKPAWFARRFPLDDPRLAVSPVSWQGYAVALGFVGGMILAGAIYLGFMTADMPIAGMIGFVVCAVLTGGGFLTVSRLKADMTRTVEDYKAGRLNAP